MEGLLSPGINPGSALSPFAPFNVRAERHPSSRQLAACSCRPGPSGYAGVMQVRIRKAKPADRDQLAQLREALWPKTSAAEHARELEPILAGETPGTMPLIKLRRRNYGWHADRLRRSRSAVARRWLRSCALGGLSGGLVCHRGVSPMRYRSPTSCRRGRLGSDPRLRRDGFRHMDRQRAFAKLPRSVGLRSR